MNLMQRAMYPCEQIVAFTYDYLEGKLPPVSGLRFHLHLSGCKNCTEFVRLYRMAANPKRFLEENPVPDHLVARTLAFLEKESGWVRRSEPAGP